MTSSDGWGGGGQRAGNTEIARAARHEPPTGGEAGGPKPGLLARSRRRQGLLVPLLPARPRHARGAGSGASRRRRPGGWPRPLLPPPATAAAAASMINADRSSASAAGESRRLWQRRWRWLRLLRSSCRRDQLRRARIGLTQQLVERLDHNEACLLIDDIL